jgi:PAS domain S-box-containing protein
MKTKHNLEQLHDFIELISDLVFVKNLEGQYTHCNKVFLRFLDKKREDVLLKTDYDLFTKKDADKFIKIDNQVLKTKKIKHNQEELFHENGNIYYFSTSKQVLYDLDNNEVGLFCMARNMTISKEYELIYQDNKLLLEYIVVENNLKKILEKIVLLAEKRNKKSKCSILLLDKEKKHLLNGSSPSLPFFYTQAINGIEIGEKVGSCGSAAFKKQRVIIQNINTHENWQPYLELTQKANLHACWSEPIISSSNEILGTFAIYNTVPKAPSNFELMLISAYSNLAAIAIEKDANYKIILEKEYQLSQLFNNTQSGLMYVNSKRKILQVNQHFADIFGYTSPEELIGINANKFHISIKSYKEFGKKFSKIIKDEKIFNIEHQFIKKDGTIIWCELAGKALNVDDSSSKQSKGILWTVKDISLRKSYEEELKNSELLNSSILATIPQMIWLKDIKGRYITCNHEFEKYFDVKKEEIIGKTDYDLRDKKMADAFKHYDKLAMESLHPLINEEWIVNKYDNKRILLETTKKAMRDQNGMIIGTLGIGHDITKRKEEFEKVEELNKLASSLAQSQASLLSLFDKGDSVLFKWKNNSTWDAEYVSLSVTQLFGYKKEDFLLNHFKYTDHIYKDDLQTVRSEVAYAIEHNIDYFKHKPYRIIDKTNRIKWVLDCTVIQRDSNNNIKYFIGYVTDITKHLKQQELIFQQSKLASMGEMIGNIAHQWRQPLSIISTIATASKLEKELDVLTDEIFFNNMEMINTNAQYLSQTIDDFREFVKADRELNDFNLSNAIKSFLNVVNSSIISNNIKTVLDFDDNIIMNNYQNDMIQAFINIINNSIDALIQKPNDDRYFFIKTEKEEKKIIIKLKDNAGGIDNTLIDKVFEPYTTNKHKGLGTGLGLNITYNFIVMGMKGNISVENVTYSYKNKEYSGCEFTVTFDNYFR